MQKFMNRTTRLLFLFLVISNSVFSQVVRKYSNDFLEIGVGARGLGMSNAQVATADDAYASYYNPAGLINIPNTFQIGFMHNEYFAGIAKYDYLVVAIPVVPKKRVIGFSFYRFGIDDIPNTLFLIQPDGSINYNNITSFSSADYAFMFHYAEALPIPGLSIGGTAKIIYRQIGSFAKAYGFGIDAALQYRIFRYFTPEVEFNNTYWSNGTRNGRDQLFITPGLLIGRLPIAPGLGWTVGFGYQTAITPKFQASPLLPAYDHAWLLTTRFAF